MLNAKELEDIPNRFNRRLWLRKRILTIEKFSQQLKLLEFQNRPLFFQWNNICISVVPQIAHDIALNTY